MMTRPILDTDTESYWLCSTLFFSQEPVVREELFLNLNSVRREVLAIAEALDTGNSSLTRTSEAFKKQALNFLILNCGEDSRETVKADFETHFQSATRDIATKYPTIDITTIANMAKEVMLVASQNFEMRLWGVGDLDKSEFQSKVAKGAAGAAVVSLFYPPSWLYGFGAALGAAYCKWESNSLYQEYKNCVAQQAKVAALCCHLLSQPPQTAVSIL